MSPFRLSLISLRMFYFFSVHLFFKVIPKYFMEMATHSSVLAWRIPGENPRDGGAWWAAIYGVAQSQTRLKGLSSSSSMCLFISKLLIHPSPISPLATINLFSLFTSLFLSCE